VTVFTKAVLLRYSLLFALGKAKLYGRKLKFTDGERDEITKRTIDEMRRYSSWKDLDDELPPQIEQP